MNLQCSWKVIRETLKHYLFGSYGWGDGQWMRDWEERMKNLGATIVGEEGLIIQEAPDSAAEERCRDLGKELVASAS